MKVARLVSGRRLSAVGARVLVAAAGAVVLHSADVQAASRYLDVNGTSAGSGVTEGGTYTWNQASTANWGTLDGTGTIVTFASGDTAIFSAGTDATGLNYTVNLGSAITAASVTVEEGNLTLGGAQTLTLSGGITIGSAAGATTLGSATSVVFNSSQTWANNSSSTFTINSGIKPDASSRTLTFGGSGTTIVNGVMSNTGTLSLNINAPGGMVTFTGANTYTGGTTVTNGTLKLDFSASAQASNIINNTANSSALTLSGGTLNVTGNSGATNSQRFNGTTFTANTASALRFTQNGAASLGATLGGMTRNAGSTLDLTLPTSGTLATSSTGNVMGGILVSATSNGIAYATVDGTDWATNTSGTIGQLATYDANDFSAAGRNVDVSGAQSPAAFTINTLRFNQSATTLTLNSSGASTVNTGGILVTSAGNAVISGSGSAAIRPGGGKELVVINNGSLEFAVPIADSASGATAVTLSGTGTTTFSAANSFTGALNQNSAAATLNLNGGIQNTTVAGGTSSILNGLITGTGGLNKLGGGSLTMGNNANTYSGGTGVTGTIQFVTGSSGTTVAGGAVVSGPFGTGTLTLNNGTQLNVRSNPLTLANDLATSGFTTIDGSGASYALNLNQAGVTGAAGLVVAGNTTLYNNNTAVTIAHNVSGDYSLLLRKAGNSGSFTLSGAVANNGDLSLSSAGSGSVITVSGNVNNSGLITNIGYGTATNTISGQIGSNVAGIQQSNVNGTLVLSNAGNAYSGPTNVYGGALQANSGAGLPTASNLVLDGGVLQGSGATTFSRSIGIGSGQVQFGANGGGFAANGGAMVVQLNGGTGTLTWGSGGFLTGNAPLLLGSNTANNALDFQNGIDLNGGARSVVVTAGSSNTEKISGAISDSAGGGSLTKKGSGTLILSGANTYSGTTTISGGTIKVDANTGSLSSSSPLAFNGTGTFLYDNTTSTGVRSQTLGELSFSGGDATVQSTRTASQNLGLTFSSLAARGAGATGNFVVSGGVNGTSNGITLQGISAGVIDPGIFFAGGTSSASFAYYTGSYVRGINWGSEGTTQAGGTSISSASYAQTTAAISAQASATFSGLNIVNTTNSAQAFTLAGGATVTASTILRSGNGGNTSTTTISGGTALQAATDADMIIRTDSSNDLLVVATPIVANGTNNLVKSGSGTLTLNATNTYTGTTYANAGSLNIYGSGGTRVPGNLVVNGAAVLQGDSASSTNLIGTGASITLNSGSYRLQGGSQTIAGYTQNGGSGQSNANAFAASMTVSGITTINAGTWNVGGNQGSSWTTDKLVINGGTNTLSIPSNNGSMVLTVGAGGLEINQPASGGPFTALSLVNYGQGFTSATGTFNLNGNVKFFPNAANASSTYIASSISGNVPRIDLGASARTFDIGHSSAAGSDLIVQPNIQGTGGITKIGAGVLEYTGLGSYSGATTVNNGTLRIGEFGSLTNTSAITVDGAGAIFRYSSRTPLAKSVAFGTAGGKFIYDSPVELTTLPTLSDGATFVYNSPAKLNSAINIAAGQTLGGNGVLGAVTVSGNLTPGNSPGQITIDSLTLQGGSTTTMEVGGDTLGSEYDNVTVTSGGSLAYGGTLSVVSYAGYDLAQAGTYALFTLNGVTPSGDFSAVTVGATALSDAGQTGVWVGGLYEFKQNTGVLTVAVPEPGTVALAVGVVTMGLMQRRRRHLDADEA